MNRFNEKQRAIERRRNRTAGLIKIIAAYAGAVAAVIAAPYSGGSSLAIAGALISYGSAVASEVNNQVADSSRDGIERQKEELQLRQRIQLLGIEAEETEVESAARIKTWLIEEPNLEIQVEMALIEAVQVGIRIQNRYDRARFLADNIKSRRAALAERFHSDPTSRLVFNAQLTRYRRAVDQARRWVYLAVRAAEYELSVGHPVGGIRRLLPCSAGVFGSGFFSGACPRHQRIDRG
jgi:hypothetical protein